jgi:RNAse (barnase) inhibitor barstar
LALFANSPDDRHSLDWQILRCGGIALYWREEHLAADVQWLAARSYDICEFNCAGWHSRKDMYSDIGLVLRFPDWWGRNMDALHDCLVEFPVRDDGGAALVFRKFDAYANDAGSKSMHSGRTEAEVLLDAMAEHAGFFYSTVEDSLFSPIQRIQGFRLRSVSRA